MSHARPLPFKCSAVISDVDGTLVTDDNVRTAYKRNYLSIIISRPLRGLRMLIERLGIETPVGGFNGGVIATPDLADALSRAVKIVRVELAPSDLPLPEKCQ